MYRKLESQIDGDYRCACGAPSEVRIVNPRENITLVCPCETHLVSALEKLLVGRSEQGLAAPRIQWITLSEEQKNAE